jgi:N-acetylglutamate synthase-like GNAT family acetyltransferase
LNGNTVCEIIGATYWVKTAGTIDIPILFTLQAFSTSFFHHRGFRQSERQAIVALRVALPVL